jgi:hypothetical protein
MIYKKVVWSHYQPKVREKDVLYLTKSDVNHLVRIYKRYNINPESVPVVEIRFLTDRDKLLRFIIKELDILLIEGGKFVIQSTYSADHGKFIRSLDQIKHEFSISTNYRYKNIVVEKVDTSVITSYKKIKKILPVDDTINRWTFGIVTDGNKSERVAALIDSITKLKIPSYEIIICGRYDQNTKSNELRILDDVVNVDDIRVPICRKKNKIALAASYNNLIIVHDRYLFPSDWYVNMVSYGNYYELLSMPNIGPNKGRVSDWNVFSCHPSGTVRNDLVLPEYSSWSPWWYSQGGVLIIKKNLFVDNLLDERLHWGELEDVQWSQIGSLQGWLYYFDINNKLFTNSLRLPESKTSTLKIFYLAKLSRAFFLSSLQLIKNIFNYFINKTR